MTRLLTFCLVLWTLSASAAVRWVTPYDGTTNFEYVVTHTHSSFSDGNPDAGPNIVLSNIAKWFGDTNHISFAVTEHAGYAVQGVPAYNTTGYFLNGEEITMLARHMLVMWNSSKIAGDDIFPGTSTDYQGFANDTISKGGLFGFAHPASQRYPWSAVQMTSLTNTQPFGFELYNDLTVYTTNFNQGVAVDLFDQVLTLSITSGKRWIAFAGLDQHVAYQSNAWNQVFLTSTNYSTIRTAWTNGNMTLGKNTLLWMSNATDTAYARTVVPCTYIWTKTNGTTAKTTLSALSDTYTANGTEGYVRLTVIQDANTNFMAFSQAMYPYVTNIPPSTLTLNISGNLRIGP